MGKIDASPAIWEVPDDVWQRIYPIIVEMDPAKSTGRRSKDPRRTLDDIIFRMPSGYQWNHLPRELGNGSTIVGPYSAGLNWECWSAYGRCWWRSAELGGVEWQSADCTIGKECLGGSIGRNPTVRGKGGSKRSILVDAGGGPLSLVMA